MMAVTISSGASLRVGKPAPLFEGRYLEGSAGRRNYDVSRDGQRFIMVKGAGGKSMRIRVVFNWFEELGWLVPLVPAQRAGPLKLAKPARKAILTR